MITIWSHCPFLAIFSEKMFHSIQFNPKSIFVLKYHLRMTNTFWITLRDNLELISHRTTKQNMPDFNFKKIWSQSHQNMIIISSHDGILAFILQKIIYFYPIQIPNSRYVDVMIQNDRNVLFLLIVQNWDIALCKITIFCLYLWKNESAWISAPLNFHLVEYQ